MSSNSPSPFESAIVGLIFIGLLLWGLIYGISYLGDAKKEIIKAYHAPDTTITIHNGVPDTVIIIRK